MPKAKDNDYWILQEQTAYKVYDSDYSYKVKSF